MSNNMKKTNLALFALLAIFLAGANAATAVTFEDNTLIRGEDRQIFVVRQGERVKINSLDELRRDFRGREIINVDDGALAQIRIRTDNSGSGSLNSGRGNARDNALLRAQDRKIFEVIQGERRQIRTLDELRRDFRDRQIINVDNAALRRFPVRLEDHPNALFDHNRLIRDAQNRVFVVEDNGLRHITDMNEIRREHLGQAIHNVNDDLLLANGVKLRGDGTVDDNSRQISGLDDFVNGVKLRGDGSIDDNSAAGSSDDFVNGIKLRGDGTVDDNLPRNSGIDNNAGGVDLRGDGTVDDNSASSGGGSGSGSSGQGGSDD